MAVCLIRADVWAEGVWQSQDVELGGQRLTQYSTSVQPSMVIHWNTVSMANRKLSKLVMPPFGPCQPSLHSLPLMGHWRPCPEIAHGAGSSSAIASKKREEETVSVGSQTADRVFKLSSYLAYKYIFFHFDCTNWSNHVTFEQNYKISRLEMALNFTFRRFCRTNTCNDQQHLTLSKLQCLPTKIL